MIFVRCRLCVQHSRTGQLWQLVSRAVGGSIAEDLVLRAEDTAVIFTVTHTEPGFLCQRALVGQQRDSYENLLADSGRCVARVGCDPAPQCMADRRKVRQLL